jgi:hypothetical protein
MDQGQQVISISRNQPKVNVTQHYTYDVLSETPFPELDMPIDGLVYCPGSINLKPLRGLKEADFLADLKLNTLGAIKFIQAYQKQLQSSARRFNPFVSCRVRTKNKSELHCAFFNRYAFGKQIN